MMHNYPAYVFRMTSLLEKLGIKSATYVHKDEARLFSQKFGWDKEAIARSSKAVPRLSVPHTYDPK